MLSDARTGVRVNCIRRTKTAGVSAAALVLAALAGPGVAEPIPQLEESQVRDGEYRQAAAGTESRIVSQKDDAEPSNYALALEELQFAAQDQLGERFVEFLPRDEDLKDLVLVVVQLSPDQERQLRELVDGSRANELGARVEIRVSEFGWEDVASAVGDIANHLIEEEVAFTTVEPNYIDGQVEVTVEPDTDRSARSSDSTGETERAAESAGSAVPVVVTETDQQFMSGESRHSYPPYKGGQRLEVIPGIGGHCSAGLGVWARSDQRKMGSTAGHCGRAGNNVWTGWNGSSYNIRFGQTFWNTFWSTNPSQADNVLIGISNQNHIGRSIFVNSNRTRHVTSRSRTDRIGPATQVYMTGATSGLQPGTVGRYPVAIFYRDLGRTVQNAMYWNGTVRGGDSGAAMYIPVGSNHASGVGNAIGFCLGNDCPATSVIQPIGIIERESRTWLTCSPVGTRCPDR